MLVTDNAEWAQRARGLRSHGVERRQFLWLGGNGDLALDAWGPWYYQMQDLGYNYRITGIQCAQGFDNLPWLRVPNLTIPEYRDLMSLYLYIVQIDFQSIGRTRTDAMTGLRQKVMGTQVFYIRVHLQPWCRQTYKCKPCEYPKAEEYYKHAFSLPLSPAMTDGDVEREVTATRGILA